jgi:hypothetical protein
MPYETTTLSLFLQSLFPKTDVLEEAVDLSYDRLLMNEWMPYVIENINSLLFDLFL